MAHIELQGSQSTYLFNPDDQSSILGRGGMGIVFKGHDKNSGKEVAVKVVYREIAESMDNIERARREASIKIKHKNLIQNLDFIELNGVYHIVSEYIDGESLRDHLNKQPGGKLNPDKAKAIITEVLDGLSVLHKQGIVHRDIDPSNIMVCRNGSVKLTDFGIAKNQNNSGGTLTGTGMFMGKLQYASPEQIRGERKEIDAQSDLYSLGIVLYELLAGQRPFEATNEYDLMNKQINQPLPRNRDISELLFAVVEKAAAKEKSKRFANAESFKSELMGGTVVVQHHSLSADDYFRKAEKARENKQYKAAIEDYNEAIKRYEFKSDYFFYKGYCEQQLGNALFAISDYSKSIKIEPNNAAAYYNRAACYTKIGENENAQKDYLNAFRLDSSLIEQAKDAAPWNNQLIKALLTVLPEEEKGRFCYEMSKYKLNREDVLFLLREAIENGYSRARFKLIFNILFNWEGCETVEAIGYIIMIISVLGFVIAGIIYLFSL